MRILPTRLRPNTRRERGQATTEVVLLLPLFMFFLFAFSKVFAMLVLIQKMEIASYYAARRWQLESHRNVAYEHFDEGQLCKDIEEKAACYLGFSRAECPNTVIQSFLSLDSIKLCPIQRTQVWNIVTLTVRTKPINTPVLKFQTPPLEVTKYVPNRDRPIAFVLPGLQNSP
ncbi:MAG: hypothetical protein WCU88_04025 [Elusimicrobiota bacterium]|jgi:hypothetical protein